MEMCKNHQFRHIYQILEYDGVIELDFIFLSLGKPEGRNINNSRIVVQWMGLAKYKPSDVKNSAGGTIIA